MASTQNLAMQTFNLTLPDGVTVIPVGVADINSWLQYGVRVSINYATQIGASAAVLAALLLTTRAEKRATAIFWLNMLALVLNIPRLVLACCYFTSAWYGFYETFAGDYSDIASSDYATSIAVLPLVLVVHAAINASLVLQARAICATMRQAHRTMVTLISVMVALAALGVRFALTVWNIRFILAAEDFAPFAWLVAANNYMTAGSVCFFSAIFVAKLGEALLRRRRMHMMKFGPLQVLFVGACQTLVVPALFSVLQNVTSAPELGTQALTIVALSLPLTSMWASTFVDRVPHGGQNIQHEEQQLAGVGNTGGNGFATQCPKASGETRTSSKRGILSSTFSESAGTTTETANTLEKGSVASSSVPSSPKECIELSESGSGVLGTKERKGSVAGGTSVDEGETDDLDREMRVHLGRSMI